MFVAYFKLSSLLKDEIAMSLKPKILDGIYKLINRWLCKNQEELEADIQKQKLAKKEKRWKWTEIDQSNK